jgi:thymidylate synthase (FAD)
MLMNVELVGLTQPSVTTGCGSAGELVAWAARVSNPENQNNKETAPKLLKYLIKNEHWSPFEMVSVQMSITTTRDISRQIIRHRTFSFQEFSQRYAEAPDLLYEREARLQDPKNRQNSVEIDTESSAARKFKRAQEDVGMYAKKRYNEALDSGIAKEQARALLPEGLTETTLIMSGTLRSWIHYCQLRKGNGTQKEHREIAQRCWDILSGHFPDVRLALES